MQISPLTAFIEALIKVRFGDVKHSSSWRQMSAHHSERERIHNTFTLLDINPKLNSSSKLSWLALYLSLKSRKYHFRLQLFTVHASVDSTHDTSEALLTEMDESTVIACGGRSRAGLLLGDKNSTRVTVRRTLRHREQSVYIQLCAAGNEYLYMTWSERGCAFCFFFFCHVTVIPLKKLKLLEMSQSKVFVGEEKPSSSHNLPRNNINWKNKNGQVGFENSVKCGKNWKQPANQYISTIL